MGLGVVKDPGTQLDGRGTEWVSTPLRENPPRIPGRCMGRGPGKSEAEGRRGKLAGI